ncbi:YebC/PmpR family DNA-binding transcriptional regulator, partial [Weissella cibaria]|nr:YebC/PmpR family DNA-binding transcriptional regulator [Weissella cibaria]
GQSGSVAFLFERKSVFEIPAAGVDELDLFERVVEAGAEDLTREDDTFIVTAPAEQFGAVQAVLEAAGIRVEEAGLQRIPTTTVSLAPEAARKVAALIERIEDHPDVQAVYTTLQLDEATIEAIT